MGQEIRHPMNERTKSYKTTVPAQSIFFTPITVKSEQKSENRAQDDAVFWIPILRLYYHPQFTSRKGNETEDDRKAFPEVKTCCHHGLFTVSVTTATA